jgi:hypothetical protein
MRQVASYTFGLLLGLLTVYAGEASAQTQGTVGETSTGVSNMTLTLPNLVKITDVANLNFNNAGSGTKYSGQGDVEADDAVCIYSNMEKLGGTANRYTVTMTGNGSGSTFKLTCTSGECLTTTSGGPDLISYQPFWNDEAAPATVTVGSKGGASAQLANQTGWNNRHDCTLDDSGASGNNANFRVLIEENDMLDDKRIGTYTGTLTILITPNP